MTDIHEDPMGDVTRLLHRRSPSEPPHVAMHATALWLDQFKAGSPATTICLGCPTAIRFEDVVIDE